MLKLAVESQPYLTWALSLCAGILLSAMDIRFRRIPDVILAIWALASIIIAALLFPGGILARFLCSGISFLAMALFQAWKKNGLGFGDVKFIAVAAFNLGPFHTWLMLICAALLALLYYVLFYLLYLFIGRRLGWTALRQKRIPFAPFLSLGIFLTLFAPRAFP